jgi:aminotransferase in exopolysaccharide biosynthesis
MAKNESIPQRFEPGAQAVADEIPLSEPEIRGNEWQYVKECLDTNFVSSVGPFVTRFEETFAESQAAPYAVACASGTAAIHIALEVAGVGRGDEVFVSDFTFVATANPIVYRGAQPVFVDADDMSWNMDPRLVVAELERRAARGLRQPKAVLVAHVLGLPADVAAMKYACDHHGILLIEDAAEALGASYSSGPLAGNRVGTVGLLGCFSFNGNKIITTGGGGMIVTSDIDLARRSRHLTTQAKLPGPEYIHDTVGYNYRLTNLAAALGLAQLEKLPEFLARKRAIAARYDAILRGIHGITVPPRPEWADPSVWLYSIMIDDSVTGVDRTQVFERLRAVGIQTRPVWAPLHKMSFYKHAPRLGGSVAERLFAQGLSLPCSVGLASEAQDRVIEELLACIQVTG